jgi:hypothetical protein
MQVLRWENMQQGLDAGAPENAHFTCIECGCFIEQHHRPQMLASLEWRAENPKAAPFHRSFWIWNGYSPLQTT